MQVFHLILPYEDDIDFKIERGVRGSESEVRRWLNSELKEEELPRVLACAVALFQKEHGVNKQHTSTEDLPSIWDCLETAVIWERG